MRGMATGIQSDQFRAANLNPHRYENFRPSASMTKRYAARSLAVSAAIAPRIDVLQRADMTIEGENEPLAGSRGRSISADHLRLMGILACRPRCQTRGHRVAK